MSFFFRFLFFNFSNSLSLLTTRFSPPPPPPLPFSSLRFPPRSELSDTSSPSKAPSSFSVPLRQSPQDSKQNGPSAHSRRRLRDAPAPAHAHGPQAHRRLRQPADDHPPDPGTRAGELESETGVRESSGEGALKERRIQRALASMALSVSSKTTTTTTRRSATLASAPFRVELGSALHLWR